jgi:hypothetical protein
MATKFERYHNSICLLIASLVTLFSAGCGSTPVFRANFDTDRAHEAPNPSPPDSPNGDVIFWNSYAVDPSMVVVVFDGVLASNSLRFANLGDIERNRYVGFVPIEVSTSAAHIYAYWNGVSYISDEPIDIWLGWNYSRQIGGLRLYNGEVLIRNGTHSFERIGAFEHGRSQFIMLTINKSSRTFDLTFVQGDNIITRLGVNAIDPETVDDPRPVLGMGYLNGPESSAFYIVDNIIISEKRPDMP